MKAKAAGKGPLGKCSAILAGKTEGLLAPKMLMVPLDKLKEVCTSGLVKIYHSVNGRGKW